MREAWKGMIIGAVMGAAVGLALEGFRLLSQGASVRPTRSAHRLPASRRAWRTSSIAHRRRCGSRISPITQRRRRSAASERVKAAAGSGRDALSESK